MAVLAIEFHGFGRRTRMCAFFDPGETGAGHKVHGELAKNLLRGRFIPLRWAEEGKVISHHSSVTYSLVNLPGSSHTPSLDKPPKGFSSHGTHSASSSIILPRDLPKSFQGQFQPMS